MGFGGRVSGFSKNKELTVFGSYMGYNVFPRIIQVAAFKAGQLITHEVSVNDLSKGIDAARCGEAMKGMVTP